MKRPLVLAILLLVLIVGALGGIKALQFGSMIRAGQEFTIPPETVSSTTVRQETWEGTLSAVGSIAAVQGIMVQAEVPGTVSRIGFESGGLARRGDVLIEMDTATERAQLAAAEAQAELARANLARAKDLHAQDLIPRSELDAAVAAYGQTTGQADSIRATIEKKTIRAPFSGRLGIRTVNLGQFVSAGDPVVSLHSLDPVHVDFTLPEQELARIRDGMPLRVTSDAAPRRVFEGRLTALNPQIDAKTRNVRLQGTLPNKDGVLRPGMFARVELQLPESRRVNVIPATAVLHAPYGDSVFVIAETKDPTGKTSKTVKMTTVRLGESRGDLVAVARGLEAGQQIVSAGVFKLKNGTAVVVDNRLPMNPQADPRPADS